jgi:hypothetical protein
MSEQEGTPVQFPPIAEFCLNVPLYKSYTFSGDIFSLYEGYENFLGQLECFCLECQDRSIFLSAKKEPDLIKTQSSAPPPITATHMPPAAYRADQKHIDYQFVSAFLTNRLITLEFYCVRAPRHKLVFVFRLHDIRQVESQHSTFETLGDLRNKNRVTATVEVTKIGQYPSLADLATYEKNKYRKILKGDDYREFNRAIGLSAHGVGIGAFVYLRRIFERLIGEAHQQAQTEQGWDETAYSQGKMDEKIDLLKNLLPPFLVEHKRFYGILSKGIHELSEEACLHAFPVVKLGIELILDEMIIEQA